MKIISIRINNYLATWINNCTQQHKISVSEFIRDIVYEYTQNSLIDLANIRKLKSTAIVPTNRREMGYIIFTAKLLEKFVLATQEQGEILRNVAFAETQELLTELNLNNEQEQRLCISLEDHFFAKIQQEASRSQLKVIPFIRKLIIITYLKQYQPTKTEFCKLQKIAIKHQITACKLLEKLVNQHVNNADEVIKEVQLKTNNLLLQLFPA